MPGITSRIRSNEIFTKNEYQLSLRNSQSVCVNKIKSVYRKIRKTLN